MAVSLTVRRRATRRVSLTPLIDVVFILLVFFMLETTFLTEGGVQVTAPVSGSEARIGEHVIIELFDLEHVWIDGRRLGYADWWRALEGIAPADTTVEIRAGGAVSIQRVVDLLDILSDRGYRKVTVGDTRGFRP